ncbi:alpha/beta hydrolase [Aureliella helgolandensis]|uniref:Carboxylesterase NlhH n=1 Tax=Aureliella helgolandensis TaxID=2527968 RepID=A0A518G1C4_9BACT|nr:alpha/beta hydrolase [Aureliella helgolandensis]QDV22344.1 Carboxylesterase NlhH [Aureliella helgolandensis]
MFGVRVQTTRLQLTLQPAAFCLLGPALWAPLLFAIFFQGILPLEGAEPQPTSPLHIERNLLVREIDGQKLEADLYRPAGETVCPLVMMVHGGAWSAGDKSNVERHARQLAENGFAAVAIQYRLAPQHIYPAQLDDCRFALRWAAQHATAWRADPQKLGLWGYSAGAQLVAMLACQPLPGEPTISACVAGGLPSDFTHIPLDNQMLSQVMGGSRREQPELYRAASPMEFASRDTCPIFLFHGSSDLIVPYSSSRRFYERLRELSVESELLTVQGKGHLLTFIDRSAAEKTVAFLKSHLLEQTAATDRSGE